MTSRIDNAVTKAALIQPATSYTLLGGNGALTCVRTGPAAAIAAHHTFGVHAKAIQSMSAAMHEMYQKEVNESRRLIDSGNYQSLMQHKYSYTFPQHEIKEVIVGIDGTRIVYMRVVAKKTLKFYFLKTDQATINEFAKTIHSNPTLLTPEQSRALIKKQDALALKILLWGLVGFVLFVIYMVEFSGL